MHTYKPARQWFGFPYSQSHDKRGAVLVITIWIILILVLLAISIGRRTSIELKLLRYHLSRTRAFYLAKAGLERIFQEKIVDADKDYDTLNESWSNKLNDQGKEEFKDFALGNGKFTVKYDYYESGDKEPKTLYGMQDEQSKLNINKILDDVDKGANELKILLENILKDEASADAEVLTDKFIDWIDEDVVPVSTKGKEDYSQKAIVPKSMPLDRLEELLMIDGFTPEIFSLLSNYITVYGDGHININTAPEAVLVALGFTTNEAEAIIESRKDGTIIKGIEAEVVSGSFGIDPQNGIIHLAAGNISIDKERFVFNSSFYRAQSYGIMDDVTKEISTVVQIKADDKFPKRLYWYEE